jgi:hypothetical protein
LRLVRDLDIAINNGSGTVTFVIINVSGWKSFFGGWGRDNTYPDDWGRNINTDLQVDGAD